MTGSAEAAELGGHFWKSARVLIGSTEKSGLNSTAHGAAGLDALAFVLGAVARALAFLDGGASGASGASWGAYRFLLDVDEVPPEAGALFPIARARVVFGGIADGGSG